MVTLFWIARVLALTVPAGAIRAFPDRGRGTAAPRGGR
jgi:hypothetical protein